MKQKLRMQAASHGRSMEAEAREILKLAVTKFGGGIAPEPLASKGKFDHLVGIWKGRMATDQIMELTRGE